MSLIRNHFRFRAEYVCVCARPTPNVEKIEEKIMKICSYSGFWEEEEREWNKSLKRKRKNRKTKYWKKKFLCEKVPETLVKWIKQGEGGKERESVKKYKELIDGSFTQVSWFFHFSLSLPILYLLSC